MLSLAAASIVQKLWCRSSTQLRSSAAANGGRQGV
jgi:hypothetical protein